MDARLFILRWQEEVDIAREMRLPSVEGLTLLWQEEVDMAREMRLPSVEGLTLLVTNDPRRIRSFFGMEGILVLVYNSALGLSPSFPLDDHRSET